MFCEKLHSEPIFVEEYIICPFCYKQISDYYITKQSNCCEKLDVIEENSCLVCVNCGLIGNEILIFMKICTRFEKSQSI